MSCIEWLKKTFMGKRPSKFPKDYIGKYLINYYDEGEKIMNRKFFYVDRILSTGYETKEPDFELPKRSTANSAGYDFVCPERVEIPPYKLGDNPILVKTGVKAYMQNDEVLMLYNRSSNPKKKKLVIPNSVGVIDADYYGNAYNDGEIGFTFYNLSNEVVVIEKGEKLRTRCISKIFNN